MASFNLTEDAMARLRAKFEELRRAREGVRGLMEDYAADYRQFRGTPDDRREYLEGRYAPRAPQVSHLLGGDGEILWHVEDIALLLGRVPSSLSRTLGRMEREEGWRSRLLALRKDARSANGNAIHVYRQEIFDLIFDRYEEEYLLRFSRPRRGDPGKAPDIAEVRRFWSYLKAMATAQREQIARRELPDVPPMGWHDILALIWRRAFSLPMGMAFTVLFAASLGLAQRWPGAGPWIAGGSVIVLLACAALLRLRRGSPALLAGLGAGALLFALIWGVSPEGLTRSTAPHDPDPVQKILLDPIMLSDGEIDFKIEAALYNMKEILYRVSPDVEYRSTGFQEGINVHTGTPYPNFWIENLQREGLITIDVKTLDAAGKGQGQWTFTFDLDQERLKRATYPEGDA